MKKLILATGMTLALLSCKQETKEPTLAETLQSYTIEQMMDNENVGGGSFSPDKSKLLVHSNRSGIYNLYTVPAAGGEFKPVTASDSSSVFAISYFPEDERILFRMDNNGDEIYHIYLLDEGGTHKDLTPWEGARSLFRGWSEDQKAFYIASNRRDPRYNDLYKVDLQTLEPAMLYENIEGYGIGSISHNERYLVLSRPVSRDEVDLFLLDLSTQEITRINENPASNEDQDFTPDDSRLLYTTDEGSEYAYLMVYNLQTGEHTKVMERDWDIWGSYFTEKGTYRVTTINEDAKNTIEIEVVDSGEPLDLNALQGMNITSVGFSRDESKLRFFAGDSNSPSNLFVYDLDTKEVHQLSDVLNPEIDPEHLVKAEVVRFPSFDGLEIPAIYYKPHQASEQTPAPALVWVHGGPGGQSRQGFSPLIQYLVNHGYAVLAVNNRGSTGYGKTFYQGDDQNHGDKDLKDCIAGKDWLAQQSVVEGDKIGIIGGSYGGYMTMAALTFAPEEFDVGVNIFGVTNWIRTLRSIPAWWEVGRKALYTEMGDPYSSDSVRLRAISPLFHTEQVTKPLIVLQGSQDPRVLQEESDEVVAGDRKNGVPVEYVLFEDEGHGFLKKENQIEGYSKILGFLDTYLKKDPGTPIRDDAMEGAKVESE
ncbi:MAG: S9 family peptidase [Bacteroidetes bacterium]|nr:MAG: S9 family peptidase [Bacteroidota bacterium]